MKACLKIQKLKLATSCIIVAMQINHLTVIYLRLCYFKKSFVARGFRLKWTRFTFAVNSFSSSGSAVVVSHCYQLSLNFCHLLESQVKFAMGCSRKNPHPRDRRHAGNSHVRGVNWLWKSRREGGSEPKNTSSGVTLSISWMFQLLQSLSFQNIALPFQILLFFQTTDLLPHLF